jgi:hypothetical protein
VLACVVLVLSPPPDYYPPMVIISSLSSGDREASHSRDMNPFRNDAKVVLSTMAWLPYDFDVKTKGPTLVVLGHSSWAAESLSSSRG